MKRILRLGALAALIFGASAATAQTTTTYTGTIKDLAQSVVTAGQVTFTLAPPVDSTIPGTGRFTPTTVPCNINADGTLSGFVAGVVSGACKVTNNTSISPTGTSYQICVQPYFVTPGSCFYDYATGASRDISTLAPTLSTGPVNYAGPITTPVINKVVYADGFCTGGYNETCLFAAITAAGNNSKIILSPRTYTFGSAISVSSLSNVWIQGSGAGTIIQKDGTAFTCTSCTNFKISDLNFSTTTTPTVVAPGSLPTASPSTVVVIDRFGTGRGYIPTINDQDIVPTGSSGACVSNCLSAAQSAEVFDTGLYVINSTGVEISGLTGSFYSITVEDSSRVSVHDNQVYGGKQFAGIGFWKSAGGNHNVVIANNIVQYAGFSGIMIAGGDHFEVSGNEVDHNGESGVKTYQGTPLQVSYAEVTGNNASYNYYDGFDLSSTYPHVSTFSAYSVASGNHADHNHGTGFYADGKFWTFTANQASANGASGMGLDFCESTIAGNQATGNNTLGTAGLNQLSVSGNVACGGNVVVANHTDTTGNVGNGFYAGGTPSSTVIGNLEQTGNSTINTANVGALNSDITGMLPASMLALRSTGLLFKHAGGTEIDAASAGGYFNVTIPANTGTLAMTNLTQNWSGVQGFSNGNLVMHHVGTTEIDAASASGFFNATIPANTGTLAMTNLAQNWTAAQGFSNGTLVMHHVGTTEIDAASASGSFNATIPANTGTLAMTNLTQNWSGVQGFSNGTFQFHHAGTTEIDAASSGGFFTVTIPANTGTVAMTNIAQTWNGTQNFVNGISGSSTAPSGACSSVQWVFTQDGHATFCNGTTWVSKI